MPEYETITLSSNEYRNFGTLGDNETLENVIIDCRADGAAFKQNAVGDGWAIRNVGILGTPERDGKSEIGDHLFNVAGNGVIENCFVDARTSGQETGMGFFRAKSSHSGTVEMRNCFCAGAGNNASYASSAGKNGGGGGAWIYESCYHRDNTPSNFRPGTRNSKVLNCISITNDPNCTRGSYKGNGSSYGSRGVWVKHYPDQVVDNCAFYISPDDCDPGQETIEARYFGKSDGPGCEVTVTNVGVHPNTPNWPKFNERLEVDDGYARIETENIHKKPTVQVLQNGGVPTSAEMAALGNREMPVVTEFEDIDGGNTIDTTGFEITNDGSAQTDYTVIVDGEIVTTTGFGSGDSVSQDGTTATGFVNGGSDQFRYTGEITSFDYSGPEPTIFIDGSEVEPSSLIDNTAPTAVITATVDGLTVDLSGSDSTDPEGNIAAYEWAFGDGNTGTGVSTTHTYAQEGTYTVELTVIDEKNATDTAALDVSPSTTGDGGGGGDGDTGDGETGDGSTGNLAGAALLAGAVWLSRNDDN